MDSGRSFVCHRHMDTPHLSYLHRFCAPLSPFFNRKLIFKRYACVVGSYAALLIAFGTSCYLRTGYFLTQPTTLWFNFAANTYEKSTKVDYSQPVYPKGTARYIANREKLTALQCRDIWRQRSLQWLGNHKIAYLKKMPG